MIYTLTNAGLALCAALSAPCNGPHSLSVTMRSLVPDNTQEWALKYDVAQNCLDGQTCNLIGGMECLQIATFTQSDGRGGKTFVCRIPRNNQLASKE